MEPTTQSINQRDTSMTTNAPRHFEKNEQLSTLVETTPAPPRAHPDGYYAHLQHLETLVSEAVADVMVNGSLSAMMLDRMMFASMQRITQGNKWPAMAESIKRMRAQPLEFTKEAR
jgi:hypothetical protein